jgi:hypothetical protein
MILLLLAALAAQDVNDIVRRSLERDQRNARALDDYVYEVRSAETSYDGSGRAKKTKTEVEEVLQIDGSRYRRKIAENGAPLTGREAQREQEKLDQELARRKAEPPRERQKRLERERKQREDFRQMRQDIGRAFHFTLLGEEAVNGAPCWKVKADPRPDAGGRQSGMGQRILPKMRGTLWIGKSSYEWLRVEAEATETIRFGWVMASLSKGSTFKMEQAPVAPDLWHPVRFQARIKARGLGIPFNVGQNVEFANFRKFGAESKIVTVEETVTAAPPNQDKHY